MSQITVAVTVNDEPAEVMVGYDRPLREFFAVVREKDDCMNCLYSGSGFDAEALVRDLVEQTGVIVPEDLLVDLMNQREGNVMHTLIGRGGVWNTITLVG